MSIVNRGPGPFPHLARDAMKHWALASDLERIARGEHPGPEDLRDAPASYHRPDTAPRRGCSRPPEDHRREDVPDERAHHDQSRYRLRKDLFPVLSPGGTAAPLRSCWS